MARSGKKTQKKPQVVHAFACHDVLLTLPREQVATTKVLTRKKRVLPDGYDEAVKIFEEKLHLLTEGETLTPELWFGKGNVKKQADLKAAAAVLLSFGVSAYPVPAEQEAAARALADPVPDAKNESPEEPDPSDM
jgi:hypothetical protein